MLSSEGRGRWLLMREQGWWIESVINVILIVCGVGAILALAVVAHFVMKFW